MKKKKDAVAKPKAPPVAGPRTGGNFVRFADFAREICCSPTTLRRRIVNGQAKGLILMDPFSLGKPLITRASADAFIAERIKATKKELTPPESYIAVPANG